MPNNSPPPVFLAPSSSGCVISAPFGKLGIQTEMVDGSLMVTKISYLSLQTRLQAPNNDLAKEVAHQCAQYFQNAKFVFDLPLKPVGTEHQQKVWATVAKIPTGLTATYGEIAKKIHSGPRAVGSACGANYYPLVIPCHRVVAAKRLGGFMQEDSPGFYRQIKQWLLQHEGVYLD